MTKEIWLNLPVESLEKSKAFFHHLGFKFNPSHGGNGLIVGQKNFMVMLWDKKQFGHFTQTCIPDLSQSAQVLISIDAKSRTEVDELARKVQEAGGTIFAKPGENQGWMYGFGFADLDGHRWNVLFMDLSKLPSQ